MFCRLENLPETEYSILNDLKASLRSTCSVIKYGNIDIDVETFKRLSNNLRILCCIVIFIKLLLLSAHAGPVCVEIVYKVY